MNRLVNASMLLAIVAAIAVAGCGGDSGSATAGGSGGKQGRTAPPEPRSSEPTAILDAARIPGLGAVLVDSAHKTLYYFNRDKRGSGKTNCYDACAREWYPKPSGTKPLFAPGAELDEALAGTIRRRDGTVQATYNGWPLYTNIKEYNEETTHVGTKSYGGRWFPLHPSGAPAGHQFRTKNQAGTP